MIFIPTSGWGKARVYGDIWEPRKILIGFAELAVPVSLCNMGIISQFYRITEKLRSEGPQGVQPPAPSSNSRNRLLRTVSRCGLNIFTNRDATTSLGNLFHCLKVKNFFLCLNRINFLHLSL